MQKSLYYIPNTVRMEQTVPTEDMPEERIILCKYANKTIPKEDIAWKDKNTENLQINNCLT